MATACTEAGEADEALLQALAAPLVEHVQDLAPKHIVDIVPAGAGASLGALGDSIQGNARKQDTTNQLQLSRTGALSSRVR